MMGALAGLWALALTIAAAAPAEEAKPYTIKDGKVDQHT